MRWPHGLAPSPRPVLGHRTFFGWIQVRWGSGVGEGAITLLKFGGNISSSNIKSNALLKSILVLNDALLSSCALEE